VAFVAHPICATHRPKWCATNSLFSTSTRCYQSMDTIKGHGNKHSMKQESPTTEHAKKARTLEIFNHTCQALKPVGGGEGRLGAYQCRLDGDGEGAGDDLSRAPLSSNRVGFCVYLVSLGWSPFHRSDREEGGRSSCPSSARLVASPPSIRPPPPPHRQPFQTVRER
jgi:hypothetical protein